MSEEIPAVLLGWLFGHYPFFSGNFKEQILLFRSSNALQCQLQEPSDTVIKFVFINRNLIKRVVGTGQHLKRGGDLRRG